MKKFILVFGTVFAAAGVLLTLFATAILPSWGWHLQGAFASGVLLLVALPSTVVGRAIGLQYSGSNWPWWALALVVNAAWCFGLGALMGALAWRLRKSPLIARLLVAAGLAVLCVVIVVHIPSYFTTPARGNCINTLRQIEGAKHQWALEQHKLTNDVPTWEDLRPYLKRWEACPDGGIYTIGRVDQMPTCSVPRHDAFWKQAHKVLE